jgi:hypothetical protein
MEIGDTFIWFPPGDRKEHLFIVLTDPALNDGKFAAVNLTRSRGGPMALTFQVGDHPCIKRYPSDVNFGDALIFDVTNVERDIALGQAFQKEPVTDAMLEAIARRAIGHPAIPEEVEDLVKSQWHFPSD